MANGEVAVSVPSGVWTKLPNGAKAYQDSGATATVLFGSERITFQGIKGTRWVYRMGVGVDDGVTGKRLTDAELATRRFNQRERAGLLRDGMPIEAIRMLRAGYVREVLANPEALRQLRAEFGITGGDATREDG
jgi:hypothetical protein